MVTCQGAVAIRILQVIPEANERATIVIQPTILTTRTAALAQFQSVEDEQQNNSWNTAAQRPQTYTPNPYIYKVYLNK